MAPPSLRQTPSLRARQGMVMTPRLQQGIKLLAMSNLELEAYVDRQIEQNPLLTRGMGGGGADPASWAAAPAEDGLRQQLISEANMTFADRPRRMIAEFLIHSLDDAGRLTAAPDEAAEATGTSLALVKETLARLRRFGPPGLFARDLRECLALQLEAAGRLTPVMARLLDNLALVAAADHRRLARLCGVEPAEIAAMVATLRTLDPKPGAGLSGDSARPVLPDVLMHPLGDGEWRLELNPDTLPRAAIDRGYQAMIRVQAAPSPEARRFLAARRADASWLIRALDQRADTILRIAGEIVRRQDAFFREGAAALRPLTRREVALAAGVHESTVSRAVAGKRLAAPRGLFALRYFFSAAIPSADGGAARSAASVRHRIAAMIAAEGDSPLSDERILGCLRAEGVAIARRTVAKYREALGLPSSFQRRRRLAIARQESPPDAASLA